MGGDDELGKKVEKGKGRGGGGERKKKKD